jgi:hypothetical protein
MANRARATKAFDGSKTTAYTCGRSTPVVGPWLRTSDDYELPILIGEPQQYRLAFFRCRLLMTRVTIVLLDILRLYL